MMAVMMITLGSLMTAMAMAEVNIQPKVTWQPTWNLRFHLFVIDYFEDKRSFFWPWTLFSEQPIFIQDFGQQSELMQVIHQGKSQSWITVSVAYTRRCPIILGWLNFIFSSVAPFSTNCLAPVHGGQADAYGDGDHTPIIGIPGHGLTVTVMASLKCE